MERNKPTLQIKTSKRLTNKEIESITQDILQYVVENCKNCISESVSEIISSNHPQYRDVENRVFELIPKML
jgi:hypothetical protein